MITIHVQNSTQKYPVKFDDDAAIDGVPIKQARLVLSREDGILKAKAYLGDGKTRSLARLLFGCTTVPINGDYLDLRKENQRPLTGQHKSEARHRGGNLHLDKYNTRPKNLK